MRLQFLVSTQDNPYLNIAVENYLLSLPASDTVILYLWRNRQTVVIGQNQNPYAECNVDMLEQDGGYLMRRRTGGGAVYHDLGNLNFSFIAPNELYDQARQFSVLQRAVADYGLETEVSGRNDVLCKGRKFSGNAFSRSANQRLHHGTILIRTDVEVLNRYLKVKPAKLQKHGVSSVQSRVVNLYELFPADASRTLHPEGITSSNIMPHLLAAFELVYGGKAEVLDFSRIAAIPQVESLRAEFASDEWKYGRWRNFVAQHSAQFEWGGVDLSVNVDEAHAVIESVDIASDGLDLQTLDMARQLLTGASSRTAPVLPSNLNEAQVAMLHDIFELIY